MELIPLAVKFINILRNLYFAYADSFRQNIEIIRPTADFIFVSTKKKKVMKKVVLFVVLAAILTSCSFESYQCHSYGQTNNHTKHGLKSQYKYTKRRI